MHHDEDLDLLADLTPAQREAVTHSEGPLLILAGAGSGKTRVITRRVAHLLHQGVRPGNILAITFTNKAAGEMRQRIEALLPGNRVWISTFHSLGVRLLRNTPTASASTATSPSTTRPTAPSIVKLALEAAGIDNVRFTPETHLRPPSARPRTSSLSPDKYAHRPAISSRRRWPRSTRSTRRRLRDANALDFDDLLYWPALALKNNPELRAELDARFRYVLIDEYQDTNQAQYAIARGLSHGLSQPVRRRRSRSVDLQMARLRHPQHPRLRARFPERPRHHAGENYPQHAGDPGSRRAT